MIDLIEVGLVRVVAAFVSLLPMRTVRRLGARLGHLVYALDRAHRNRALANLAAAFPARPEAERRALARTMFGHFGSLLLELLRFGTYTQDEMRAATEFEGTEHVRQAFQQGKGALFFTGHFGYWEIHGIASGLTVHPGSPIAVLARPLDNPRLNAMLERIRTRTGNTVIYRNGAVRRILRALSANRPVAILIDQHMHSADAIYVDFFRRPAATTSALAALALRTGAPVIPVFALPLPDGRYRLVYEHAVDPPTTDTPDAVREFTQRCTDVLEMYVRRHPELWLWMHRRWRVTDERRPEADA